MLQIEKPAERVVGKGLPAIEDIEFGKFFTDYYFSMKHEKGSWGTPRIGPVEPIPMHPGAVVLHYAQEIFEGLKAFKQEDGSVALFRPEMNARRFNASARRMQMPEVPVEDFVQAIRELVDVEKRYVPDAPGSLYLRPTLIGTEPCIKVGAANEFLFYVLTLPAGSYFPPGKTAGVQVLVSRSVSRAAPGGLGGVKAGANYAGTLGITAVAKEKGCSQVLFLDACGGNKVEEMGGMNVFFVKGETLHTAPLGGTILPGITRDSICTLAPDLGLDVIEESMDFEDVCREIESGEITEAIACGTAAVVTSIASFLFEDGRTVALPGPTPGPVTKKIYGKLVDLQYGRAEDKYDWLVKV